MLSRKLYICITPFFPSTENWRGAYVLDQVKAIQRNSDYEVMVFTPSSLKSNDYEVDGIKVRRFKTYEMPSYLFVGLLDGINGYLFCKEVQNRKIDINAIAFVHCHTCHFAANGLALKKLNPAIKVMVQHHDLDPYTIRNGKFATFWLNTRYRVHSARRLINAVDLNICISTPVLDNLLSFPYARPAEIDVPYLQVLKNVKGMNPSKPKATYILYNGVDTELFCMRVKNSNEQTKVVLNGNDQSKLIKTNQDYSQLFRIGCIGNFQVLKGHITLIKAFEMLINKGYTNMRLSLLGTGETRPICEQYIEEHGLAEYVEWPKEVTHDKLPDYYHTLDLFVLPSFYEGFGCVYTEAYACGVPFMGCYDQGAAECIDAEEQDCWLIKPNDLGKLAKIVEEQYNNRRKQCLCKEYKIDNLVSDFLNYLKGM